MLVSCASKTILVTGASRGIGEAIAIHAGKAGARVAVHYCTNRA
ncbi:MAG: SDR family NAD(P)-dependent oxidoreductase, partial [Chitinispirillaceae bacterium]|nr:SDR family NAD(P)-dependent oxidoreductase [Chitinispirillaceae bacterium]